MTTTTTTTSSSSFGTKKMSGLSGLLTSASEADILEASIALGKIDPIRELGLDLEMARYSKRSATQPLTPKSGKQPSVR